MTSWRQVGSGKAESSQTQELLNFDVDINPRLLPCSHCPTLSVDAKANSRWSSRKTGNVGTINTESLTCAPIQPTRGWLINHGQLRKDQSCLENTQGKGLTRRVNCLRLFVVQGNIFAKNISHFSSYVAVWPLSHFKSEFLFQMWEVGVLVFISSQTLSKGRAIT